MFRRGKRIESIDGGVGKLLREDAPIGPAREKKQEPPSLRAAIEGRKKERPPKGKSIVGLRTGEKSRASLFDREKRKGREIGGVDSIREGVNLRRGERGREGNTSP